ncbi:MAG: hypothetical protein AAB875_01140, partial [Patescibacteria group bacterium]
PRGGFRPLLIQHRVCAAFFCHFSSKPTKKDHETIAGSWPLIFVLADGLGCHGRSRRLYFPFNDNA